MKRLLEQVGGAVCLIIGVFLLLPTGLMVGSAVSEGDELPLAIFAIIVLGVPAVVLITVGIRLSRKRPARADEPLVAQPPVAEPPVVTSSPPSDTPPEPIAAPDPVDDEVDWSVVEHTEEPKSKDAAQRDGYTCPSCGSALSRKASVSPKGDTKCEYCDRWFNIHEDSPPARSAQARQSAAGQRGNLVHCRDCGHQISRQATVCPSCGAPQQVGPDPAAVRREHERQNRALREKERQQRAMIAQQERAAAEEKRRQKRNGNIGCGCITVFGAFVFFAVYGNNIPDSPPVPIERPAPPPVGTEAPDPFAEPPVVKPGLILPGPVLSTLSDAGFAPGIWRESNSVDGGWCCSSLGNMIEFGPPGSGLIPLPSNLSLFVYGSGPHKLDRIVIKLNINNGDSADEGKERLWKITTALLKSLEAEAPEELESAITSAPIQFLDEAGDIDNEPLWQSEIPNATASLELEQTRLTALVFTIRAEDASTLWD